MEKKSKILIIDDAVDTVELLKKRLRFEGYVTVEAYDGEEGLQQAGECNPDLIILDVMMPKLDGYEVCQRLKSHENTKYIPILMLTAKDEIEDRIKGLDVGANDYLPKPFDYKELSARVRSLLAIKAAREKLVEEEKSEALDQMMDEVAHEIRNPLTCIGGFARRVYDSLPEGGPNKRYVKMIVNEVARLEDMIKELVELKTTAISYKEPTNINDVILEALKPFQHEFGEKGIEVKTDLVDNPPLISVDKEHMKLTLANLVENAIEAMEDTLKKRLKITSHVSDGRIEVQMSDTGKGIPKDKIKNIFDPFFTSKTSGPGVGLTLAVKIIQEHRGSLSVESEPGIGATFTIRLPIKRR
jgi:signal transduction histidine kinase